MLSIGSLFNYFNPFKRQTCYLKIPKVIGKEDHQAYGKLIFYVTSDVTHVRFANSLGALQYMPWEEVVPKTTEVHRDWTFTGVKDTGKIVFAEAKFNEAYQEKQLIVSAIESPRRKGNSQFPMDPLGWRQSSHYLLKHDFKKHAHQWSTYHDQFSNVWFPMYWHPDGYAWNSHFERGPDKNEHPVTCLAMHTYFRRYYPKKNAAVNDIGGLRFTGEFAFEGDLKGASTHLFALIGNNDKEVNPIPSSGRYHQKHPDYQIKLTSDGNFVTTSFVIPKEEGWVPHFRRNVRDLSQYIPPDLSFTEGFGIAFHGFEKGELPQGILKCRRWEFQFPD